MNSSSRFAAVLFAAQPERLMRFYQALLGWPLVERGARHLVLADAGIELVIHAIPSEFQDVQGREMAAAPTLREEAALKLVLPVASLSEARQRAAALGGGLKDETQEWVWNGLRVCDGHDPEGNVLQCRESRA